MTPVPPPPPLPAQPLGAPEALAYGLVQGVCEFLPVSSSTHLKILGRLLGASGMQPVDAAYVLLLHLPTLLAAAWVLRREIRALFGSERRLLLPLGLATLVTGALGLPLDREFGDLDRSFRFLGCALMVTGLVQILAERFKPAPKEGPWTWDRGIAVGIGQSLAGIPGLSRMGMSTSAGMLTGRSRVHAIAFSFLCALPVTAGKTLLACRKALAQGEPDFFVNRMLYGAYPLAFVVAFAAGVLTFRWMLRRCVRGTLVPFGIYCILLGGLALIWAPADTKMPAPAATPAPDDGQPQVPAEGAHGLDDHGAPPRDPAQPDLVRPAGPAGAPLPGP